MTEERFDPKKHRFGMAYWTARLGKERPFFPICIRQNFVWPSLGDYCECASIDGKRYVPAQFLSELRRAPEFDLIPMSEVRRVGIVDVAA